MRCTVEVTDGLSFEPVFVCNGNGQVDRRDKTGVSMDYDVRG